MALGSDGPFWRLTLPGPLDRHNLHCPLMASGFQSSGTFSKRWILVEVSRRMCHQGRQFCRNMLNLPLSKGKHKALQHSLRGLPPSFTAEDLRARVQHFQQHCLQMEEGPGWNKTLNVEWSN